MDAEKQSLEQELAQARRENAVLQHKIELKDMLIDLKLTPGTDRAGKNERIEQVVVMIAEAKGRYTLPMRAVSAEMGLGASTLGRWKRRLGRGQPPVGRRGPRKVKPLNLSNLRERL